MNAADWWSALDKAGFHVLRVLLSVLWQSSVLLAAVGVIAWALRRRRAAVRHAVWTAAILVAPLLPLLGWVASSTGTPQAEIPVVPSYSPAYADFEEPLPEAATRPSAPEVIAAARRKEITPSPLSYPWALAFLVYAAGAVSLLSLVNVGRIRLGRWVRRGKAITNPRVVKVFEAARGRFRIVRGFAVVESEHAHAPMTIGTLHPAILLPAGLAENLSDVELEAVAIHELAHVKRKDALLLTLLSFVRAVLFFHPLVWLGCRQVSTLAESACDDAVLDATGEPLSYAKMLARLAEGLPRRSLSTELAAGIVLSRSAFLRRVTAILSDRRDRIRKLSRWALATTVVAGLVSLALAAALPLKEKATQVAEGTSTKTDEAPAREAEGEMLIVPKVGIGEVKFGMTLDEVKNVYGESDRIDGSRSYYRGISFHASPQSELVTYALCSAAHPARPLPLGSKFEEFRGKTAEGIGLGSTEEEIIEAYGEPSERAPRYRFLGLAIMKYEGLGMTFLFREEKVGGMMIRGDEEMLRKREAEEASKKIQERAPEPAEKEAISASELWDLQRAYFEDISSFHFDVTITSVVAGEDRTSSLSSGEYEMKISLTVEGEKYRIETTSKDKATGKTNRMIWAFDGSKYQHLVGSYVYTEKTPDAKKVREYSHLLANAPIFLAYGFPREESVGVAQGKLEALKKPETWAAAAKVTRGMRRDRMFGRDGVVVTLGGYEKSFGAERSRELFFAQDLGYFPVYWEIKRVTSQGESLGTWRVSETKVVNGTVVPIVIEGEEPSPEGGPTISAVMVVDSATVKINEKVDPEIFTALVPEDDIQSGKIKVVDVNAQQKLR